jgi:hypothetical protein
MSSSERLSLLRSGLALQQSRCASRGIRQGQKPVNATQHSHAKKEEKK